jgi:hypothetical protein
MSGGSHFDNSRGEPTSPFKFTAFLACFLAVGMPYWLIPYREVNLPDALYAPGLAVVALAALVLRQRGAATFRSAVLVSAGAVPAAVFARVLVEGALDPTSHNLWPFEILIGAVLGSACAAGGALIGLLLGARSPDRK